MKKFMLIPVLIGIGGLSTGLMMHVPAHGDPQAGRDQAAAVTIGVPVGAVILWWGNFTELPAGFEECDGQTPYTRDAVLRTRKPDLRGRFPRGTENLNGFRVHQMNQGGGVARSTKPHLSTNIISHTHTLSGHTHTLPAHTHTTGDHTHTISNHAHALPNHTHTTPAHTHALPDHAHSLSAHTHLIPAREVTFNYQPGNTSITVWVPQGPGTPTLSTLGPNKDATGSGGGGATGAGGAGTTGSGGAGTTGQGGAGATGASGAGTTSAGGSGASGPPSADVTGVPNTLGAPHAHDLDENQALPPYTEFIYIIRVK